MSRVALALALAALVPATALASFPQDPPNDPLYDASPLPNSRHEQWDLTSDRGISVDRAWALSTGEGVVIADIDVGVDVDHPDLKDRFTPGFDFFMNDSSVGSETSNNHGTNVAGVLGAATDNGEGIAGIAPGAKIMPVRTADNILHQGSRLAAGIVWATDHGADVISMSLGAESRSAALDRAVAYAHRKGVVMVAAIGNESANHHNYPATYDEVIAVGGINPDTADAAAQGPLEPQTPVATDFTVRAAYSDYGPHIDLAAPTQVPTTDYGGGYPRNWSGTSAAAPHVAGVAALVKAARPSLAPVEIRQLLMGTADDLSGDQNGGDAGWDQYTGYGRVNAFEAVTAAKEGRIPPAADITAPDLFSSHRKRVVVKLIAGADWHLALGRGEQPADPDNFSTVAQGSAGRHRVVVRLGTRGDRGWTLRLRAGEGDLIGEDRGFIYRNRDPMLKRGYPRRLGSSGESSPVLADLTGDGVDEIVIATTDGRMRAWQGRSGKLVRGWPRHSRTAFATRSAARRIGRIRAGFLGTPAVADIAGSRRPEVVASALDGRVYAWHHDGRRVRGFPVRIDARRPPSPERDAAIYASPALAQLDGRGKLDVVVGAADGKVYAWNGRGARLDGWPVEARDGEDRERIVSSPAVGDIDGDEKPDIVEATAEVYGSTPQTEGRVYAWDANGELKPGWPIKPPALAADAIPIAGEGTPASPSLADVDGDGADEVAIAAFTGQPDLYRGDGSQFSGGQHFTTVGKGSESRTTAMSAIALGSNGAFGRLSEDGPLAFFSGLVDTQFALATQAPAQRIPYQHIVGGWDAESGSYLSGFPAPVEQLQILTAPAIADVDGDGSAEVIAGTSGLYLHAIREDGSEPDGWAKNTGGWLFAGPAVGDVDGDGKLEVVAVTREGYLWVWDTPSPASAPVEWGSFRHDARNTGRYP
ncbi:MAG: S8 family serine peptidase [Thermoleophilaceae bacterium]